MTRWTDTDIAVLSTRYPHELTERIAADLGRKVGMVYQKAYGLGLKKSAEYLASDAAGRTRGERGGTSRFRKGLTPWNKGIRFISGGRSAEAQFKPGHKPHNTKVIGEYRLDGDGVLQRKIGTSTGSNSKRWRGVHELVWIEVHGQLPPKHIVIFRPGMRTALLEEITIEKVECISLAENMRRNTVHNLPKELALVCQLKGALNRQINKRKST
jgi:hypothetical protein